MKFTPKEIIAMALQVGVREYGPNTRNWSFDLSELESFVALVADKAAATEREACNKWRQAIDHEMVVAHLGVAKPEDDPSALLRKVIQWNVDVALNPDVSEPARALLARERGLCINDCRELASHLRCFQDKQGGSIADACAAAIDERGRKEGAC